MVGYERGEHAVVSDLDLYWENVDSPYGTLLGGLAKDMDVEEDEFLPVLSAAGHAVSEEGSYEEGVHLMNQAAADMLEGRSVEEAMRHVNRYITVEGPEYGLEAMDPSNMLGDLGLDLSSNRSRLKPDRYVVSRLSMLPRTGVSIFFDTDIPHPFSDILVSRGLEMPDAFLMAPTLGNEDLVFDGSYHPVEDKTEILSYAPEGRKISEYGFLEVAGDSPRDLGLVEEADKSRLRKGHELRHYPGIEEISNRGNVSVGETPEEIVNGIYRDLQDEIFGANNSSGRAQSFV